MKSWNILRQCFVEVPLATITGSSLLGFVCISFAHLDFVIFSPFFLADFLKLCQVGWGESVNSNVQVFPQILSGIEVWTLAGPLKDFHILVLKPFQCCFGCMLGIIVLLERNLCRSLRSFPLWSRYSPWIHCSFYPCKSTSPCHRKASP